ncbi:hypothetical protein [Sphingomonas guangdongensis]|uniref:hypothetical protein n=1 Tax=Sphingomonas guangdongensis TaxID=1141890 RepID=UPI001C546725|nr:hypothetical protein [Sphingomonas guangdongensis]
MDSDSEAITGASCVAHRHVATFIYLRDGGSTRMVSVDPGDLHTALEHDRQTSDSVMASRSE